MLLVRAAERDGDRHAANRGSVGAGADLHRAERDIDAALAQRVVIAHMRAGPAGPIRRALALVITLFLFLVFRIWARELPIVLPLCVPLGSALKHFPHL